MTTSERLITSGRIPDPALRLATRAAITQRLLTERFRGRGDDSLASAALRRSEGPIALATDEANDQHYAVAPEFFETVLGPRLKYSCCLYESAATTLAQAEEAMLELTIARAAVEDGMSILDLGCGWGSVTLWIAENFPDVEITSVSNSAAQRGLIERRAAERGLADRINVLTVDVNELRLQQRFDRVISVEMFEHARNWKALLALVAEHLEPGGSAFVHTFAHRRYAYEYEDGWMANRFFTGGTMPAAGLMGQLDDDLRVEEQWWVNGTHYSRTSRDWLEKLDANRDAAVQALAKTAGPDAEAARHEWRLFFIAVEELFGFRGGNEWGVVHQRLVRSK